MRVLTDIDVLGKRVFLRGDLDVSIADVANSKFEIRNSKLSEVSVRLQNIKPTVDWLLGHGVRQVIIAGHMGRPSLKLRNGKPSFYESELSTKKLVPVLEEILGQKIEFSPDVILRPKVEESQQRSFTSVQDDKKMVQDDKKMVQDDRIILLENLRFWEGEEKNEPDFAKILASLADVYVNDAFGVCHRNHASIVGVPAIFAHVEDPEHSRRAAGLHLEQEIVHLTELIKDPKRPFAAIVGGAKIETKVPVIENLAKIANTVLVGGELALQGETLRGYGERVLIASLTADGKDIDEESIRRFAEIIKNAKTIVWNGPMGVYEEGFERGTMAIAEAIIQSGSYSVVGGGETTAFLGLKNLLDKFSFVSSGGGAMLEFLAGNELPGVKALY